MADHEHDPNSVRMLQRMIAYVRDEAVRLGILDVATLLQHAEAAVTGFTTTGSAGEVLDAYCRSETRIAH